jgi:hypothetical protein
LSNFCSTGDGVSRKEVPRRYDRECTRINRGERLFACWFTEVCKERVRLNERWLGNESFNQSLGRQDVLLKNRHGKGSESESESVLVDQESQASKHGNQWAEGMGASRGVVLVPWSDRQFPKAPLRSHLATSQPLPSPHRDLFFLCSFLIPLSLSLSLSLRLSAKNAVARGWPFCPLPSVSLCGGGSRGVRTGNL